MKMVSGAFKRRKIESEINIGTKILIPIIFSPSAMLMQKIVRKKLIYVTYEGDEHLDNNYYYSHSDNCKPYGLGAQDRKDRCPPKNPYAV